MANKTGDLITVFQNQTTNITGDPIILRLASNKAVVFAWGIWDGATLVIEASTIPDSQGNRAWIIVKDRLNNDFVFQEDTQITLVDFVPQQLLRGRIIGAGAGTNINCNLQII